MVRKTLEFIAILLYMNNTLESHRFFPYVAWAIVVGFAIFTYMLTVRVNEEISGLDTSLDNLELRLDRLEKQQGIQ